MWLLVGAPRSDLLVGIGWNRLNQGDGAARIQDHLYLFATDLNGTLWSSTGDSPMHNAASQPCAGSHDHFLSDLCGSWISRQQPEVSEAR